MLPKDTPYPYDDMPEENYFGEFRELVSSIGPFAPKDNDKDKNHEYPDKEDPDDTFNEFSIFPKY
ncbi:hypothetical protein G9F72_001100 [Clostridium estertheticum]|uniref:hypothetical protein n=1 Tax=Clostridium estertheticum TaxID=238834 RepID=UPI0013E96358|nr:hypothetical protein [Clostridium estertheticum]MBZ9684958.1 hypothetical protein [Clostridium estertheticum]